MFAYFSFYFLEVLGMSGPDMHDVIQLYQKHIGLLSGGQRDKLYQISDEGMSPFVIGCAILRAKQEQRLKQQQGQPKRISFNYLFSIIQDWLNHGITTEESFRSYWQGQQSYVSQKKGELNGYGKATGRQVFGQDYQYTKREPAAEGFFSFLDD